MRTEKTFILVLSGRECGKLSKQSEYGIFHGFSIPYPDWTTCCQGRGKGGAAPHDMGGPGLRGALTERKERRKKEKKKRRKREEKEKK